MQTQCLAYDYVFDTGNPKVVEVSYAFARKGYLPCPGYWDQNLNWHEGEFTPEHFMIENFVEVIKMNKAHHG